MKLNNKGFTLVELIIVVAIIAVLATVLAPQYLQYVERSRESNDTQVAQMLNDAAVLAIADPANGIPSNRFIEVLWATGPESAAGTDGALLIRYPSSAGRISVFNDTSNTADNVAPMASGDGSIEKFSSAIIETFGVEMQSASAVVSGIGQGYIGFIGDAQSKIGNSTILCFHINTSTGEVALAKHSLSTASVNEWLKLGFDATPAP